MEVEALGNACLQSGKRTWAGGGGATHIGLKNSLLTEYSNDYSTKLLIVAGGGGGTGDSCYSDAQIKGGSAGGYQAQTGYYGGSYNLSSSAKGRAGGGGNQNTYGSAGSMENSESYVNAAFGKGGFTISNYGAGGGGGFYGGGAGSADAGGGGGSGYINTSKLTNAFMYGYNVSTSSATATKTYSTTNVSSTPTSNYAKSGDGVARITPVN